MKSVSLKAYAKINLGLAVMGRREDGFHELRTVYQSISLSDRLDVSISSGSTGVKLETKGIAVPTGKDNLAVRAAEALMDELKRKRRVSLYLWKRIPAGSGLGGASSDAAAVVRALLYLEKKKLPSGRLLRLAANLGSDVPFFLFGGRALGIGRGEEVYPLPEEPNRSCVVVFPGTSVSTVEAYRRLDAPLLTSHESNHNIELFCGRTNERAWDRLGNDFERSVFRLIPQLAGVKKSLLRCGACVSLLSGSGSAVFGLFDDHRQAQEAVRRLRRPGLDVYLARTVSRREFQSQLPGSEMK
jgi:4-diphosphocytidyl-2-C-methyl-D-erythritol kinase